MGMRVRVVVVDPGTSACRAKYVIDHNLRVELHDLDTGAALALRSWEPKSLCSRITINPETANTTTSTSGIHIRPTTPVILLLPQAPASGPRGIEDPEHLRPIVGRPTQPRRLFCSRGARWQAAQSDRRTQTSRSPDRPGCPAGPSRPGRPRGALATLRRYQATSTNLQTGGRSRGA